MMHDPKVQVDSYVENQKSIINDWENKNSRFVTMHDGFDEDVNFYGDNRFAP